MKRQYQRRQYGGGKEIDQLEDKIEQIPSLSHSDAFLRKPFKDSVLSEFDHANEEEKFYIVKDLCTIIEKLTTRQQAGKIMALAGLHQLKADEAEDMDILSLMNRVSGPYFR